MLRRHFKFSTQHLLSGSSVFTTSSSCAELRYDNRYTGTYNSIIEKVLVLSYYDVYKPSQCYERNEKLTIHFRQVLSYYKP
ncbi:hypothetical protein SCHPADRAFT_158317 [Schizopora paradoxa]|uniref:Uncharacterized protein n=1 Tax=Schizopora paradoxa TaxID=27342 RepID=A0A0H2S7C0_9AGAM|nr:hypothetical protein SCHPADRAFT_158317 [Schizopora paradoxa]